MEGHAQAPAFAALGRYFAEVEGKPEQAMRCYKRALALDPSVSVAGSEEGGGRAGPRPSWVNNVLGALAEEAGAAAGPAGKGTPSLRGEDSAAAADGRRLASPASPASA